jgi:hypothetical protein
MMQTRTKHRSRAHKIIPGTLLFLLSVIGCAWGTLNGPGSSFVSTPAGGVLVTAINADATEVTFDLDKEYTGAWKVYTKAEGGAALTTVSADSEIKDGKPVLVLESEDGPIVPRTYYVSLTREGKAESNRLALWGEPRVDPNPMSLAKRFGLAERGIPDALPDGADGVSAVFNLLHGHIASVGAGGAGNTIPGILLGDWIDLPSLSVAAYGGGGGFTATDAEVPGHGRLLRLLVVGNNSFNTDRAQAIDAQYGLYSSPGEAYNPADDIKDHNNGTPHVVFQFQNLFDTRRMDGIDNQGYAGCDIRPYLTPVDGDADSGKFLTGLTDAGLPADCLFAPIQYTVNAEGGGNTRIQDKVWLPTMRELFWKDPSVLIKDFRPDREDPDWQPRLEYYTSNETRKKGKLNPGDDYTWTSSTYRDYANGHGFCVFNASTGTIGSPDYSDGGSNGWVCPAFCVK